MNIIPLLIDMCLNLFPGEKPRLQRWLISRPDFRNVMEMRLENQGMTSLYEEIKVLSEQNAVSEEGDEEVKEGEVSGTDLEAEGVALSDEIENPALPEQKGDGKNAPEEIIRKTSGSFTGFSYGEEILELMEVPEGTVLVSVNRDLIVQRTYNKDRKLVSRLVWKNGTDSKSQILLSRKDWLYAGEERKTLRRITEEDFQHKTATETLMTDEQKIKSLKVWSSGDDGNRTLIKSCSYSYDEQKRLSALSTVTVYEGKEKKARLVYNYKENIEEPDERYYENGVLRSFTEHKNEREKVITYYFDGGFKVRAFYEDGEKVRETVVSDAPKKQVE